jgi:hypothetical protein
MSCWDDVLLTTSSLENTAHEDEPARFPAIDFINSWLTRNYHSVLFPVRAPSTTMQCPAYCFVTMCKSLHDAVFLEVVRNAPWEWAEQVQLFIRGEDDRGFQQIALWESVLEPA